MLARASGKAASNALQRLYPQFQAADHAGWQKVYERAQKVPPMPLKAIGDEGEPVNNPCAKAYRAILRAEKNGADIRTYFEDSPYGWARDAIDGALAGAVGSGLLRAEDERGQTQDPKELERKSIGKFTFKVESATVTTPQRIQIRKVMQKLGFTPKQGEELMHVPPFVQKMLELADSAGGEAPKPQRPDTAFLEDIAPHSG